MGMLYAIENLISSDTPLFSSSEDAAEWVSLDNLYNKRPSKPFRFTGQGSIGNPEWICVDLMAAQKVTFVGVFNHNMILSAVGDSLYIQGCDSACRGESGECNWDAPPYELSLEDRIVENFRNLYREIDATYRYFTLEIIDQNNPYALEIGELFLGTTERFTNAKLQPGMADGPMFTRTKQTTHYGQNWIQSLSESYRFSIEIINTGLANQVDELNYFLRRVHENGGKFVFIPREDLPFAYYVFLDNERDFANQIVRGRTDRVYSYRLELQSLTEGISLL